MDIDWGNIIKFVGISGLSLGALTFMSKALLKHLFEKDKERFKTDLTIDLEKHKSELEKERIKLQVSYSNIYIRQAEAILEIYEIIDLVENLALLTSGDTKDSSTYRDFNEEWKKLIHCFRKKKILLPDHICNAVADLIRKSLFGVENDKAYIHVLEKGNIPSNIIDEYIDKMEKNRNKLLELTEIKCFLEKEFRKLLCINSDIKN